MIRKTIYFILVIIFGIFLYFSRHDVVTISEAIRQGKTIWILVALLVEMLYFILYINIFRKAFELVGLKRTFLEISPLVFGAFFVNILAPATGHAGTILFADDSKRRSESVGKTVVGVFITFFAIYLALVAFLIIGVINLRIIGELGFGEIMASIIYLAITLAPILALWAGHFRPSALRKILNFIFNAQQWLKNVFRKTKTKSKSWVDESLSEIIEAAESAAKNPKKSAQLVLIAVISHFINIICLLFIFFSIGIKIKYGIVITGYAFGEITRVISPQPEGVGTVELTMVFIFSMFSISTLLATTAVIIYRAMNVWVPMFIGFLSLRTIKSFKSEPQKS